MGSWDVTAVSPGETPRMDSAIPCGPVRRGEAGAVRPVPQGTANPPGLNGVLSPWG